MKAAQVSGKALDRRNDMQFDEGVLRLKNLLLSGGWPTEIRWVLADQMISFPRQVFVFRHEANRRAEERLQELFAAWYGLAPAVHFRAIAHDKRITYATVESIEELGEGEAMFIADGLKISRPETPPAVRVKTSRILWRLLERTHREWIDRRDRALGLKGSKSRENALSNSA